MVEITAFILLVLIFLIMIVIACAQVSGNISDLEEWEAEIREAEIQQIRESEDSSR